MNDRFLNGLEPLFPWMSDLLIDILPIIIMVGLIGLILSFVQTGWPLSFLLPYIGWEVLLSTPHNTYTLHESEYAVACSQKAEDGGHRMTDEMDILWAALFEANQTVIEIILLILVFWFFFLPLPITRQNFFGDSYIAGWERPLVVQLFWLVVRWIHPKVETYGDE